MKLTDFDNYSKIVKVLFTILLIVIFCLQIYLIFKVYPEEREIFLECEKSILCEYGYLPENLCYGYKYGQVYSNNPLIDVPLKIKVDVPLKINNVESNNGG